MSFKLKSLLKVLRNQVMVSWEEDRDTGGCLGNCGALEGRGGNFYASSKITPRKTESLTVGVLVIHVISCFMVLCHSCFMIL